MASGGSREHGGDGPEVGPRSRAGLVIDQLLSRGPTTRALAASEVTGSEANDPWTSVGRVLRITTPSLLEAHLAWLVARAAGTCHLSPRRFLVEDQARILISALEERDEDDAVSRALDDPWTPDDVPDDDDGITAYASALNDATASPTSPPLCVALARSAGNVATEILDHRNSSTRRRRVG